MNKQNPILSCAGRPSASIDAELLNELLLSYTPNLVGIRIKAENLSQAFYAISNYTDGGEEALKQFKSIINREFLQIQLMEAASLARTADASADLATSEFPL
jgi:hypothetical protein